MQDNYPLIFHPKYSISTCPPKLKKIFIRNCLLIEIFKILKKSCFIINIEYPKSIIRYSQTPFYIYFTKILTLSNLYDIFIDTLSVKSYQIQYKIFKVQYLTDIYFSLFIAYLKLNIQWILLFFEVDIIEYLKCPWLLSSL